MRRFFARHSAYLAQSGYEPSSLIVVQRRKKRADCARLPAVEFASTLGHRKVFAMGQLEQHPGLGKAELRSGEIGQLQAQHAGAKAVESPHVVDHARRS
ncbi:hypothetical protein [Mycolicibacterium moriokaense]|uniref:hypothetical protein n=1 Tax=Mycolicibacterium moriokaense TaxID=39691 RepID=UPI0015E8BA87|nr:hypothetical protein [Mycolicibacterium moriokaense]